MSAIRALLFDYEGVLSPHEERAAQLAALEAGWGLEPGALLTALRKIGPYEGYLLGRFPEEEYWEVVARALDGRVRAQELRQALLALERVDAQLVRLVQQLAGRYRVALFTNAPPSFEEEVLRGRLQLDGLFDAVITSGSVGVVKPYPGIYRFALERLFVAPEECVLVDDEERHLTAARSQRIRGVLYRGYGELVTALKELGVAVGEA